METIFLIIAVGALCIACFFIGAKVGQTVSKGEPLEAPSINPMKAIQEHNDRKAAREEADKLQVILENIERYDGTGSGQKDVPRG
jgi:hypothetical protein